MYSTGAPRAEWSPRQWQAYVELQIKQGRPARELMNEVIAGGLSEAEAGTYVREAIGSRRAWSTRVIGCSVLLLLGGLGVTVTTFAGNYIYLNGQPHYAVWFGAVICGLIGIVYGLWQRNRIR